MDSYKRALRAIVTSVVRGEVTLATGDESDHAALMALCDGMDDYGGGLCSFWGSRCGDVAWHWTVDLRLESMAD
jgi:hypothetical protein